MNRYDKQRGNRHRRGYTNQWARESRLFLESNPWCVYCKKAGRATFAQCVDHIKPHKGNQDLFWNKDNWQPLCNSCHTAKTRSEKTGKLGGCDPSGQPIDAGHHWNNGG